MAHAPPCTTNTGSCLKDSILTEKMQTTEFIRCADKVRIGSSGDRIIGPSDQVWFFTSADDPISRSPDPLTESPQTLPYFGSSQVCATVSGLNSRSNPLSWSMITSGCVDFRLNLSTPPGENCAPRFWATNPASWIGSTPACSVNFTVTTSRLRPVVSTPPRSHKSFKAAADRRYPTGGGTGP